MIKFARQIDQERSEKRQCKADAERFAVRLKFVEDELRKEKIRRDQLLTDIEVLKSAQDVQASEARKKDDTIHYLQRKITELEEEHLVGEQKNHENVSPARPSPLLGTQALQRGTRQVPPGAQQGHHHPQGLGHAQEALLGPQR